MKEKLEYTVVTASERSDLLDICDKIVIPSWPEFMLNDPVANKFWGALYEKFPDYQFALIEKGTGDVLAAANSIPLSWQGELLELPDDGWDWVLQKGFDDLDAGITPNLQSALSITVADSCRGCGLSGDVVRIMKGIGMSYGLNGMIAPVRPFLKSIYPLSPMDSFATWKTEEGLPFDSWMRVHARAGAQVIKVSNHSMRISGTLTQWEQWTGMQFPESGQYVIPGALSPIEIDRSENQGLYIEPNVWMSHSMR